MNEITLSAILDSLIGFSEIFEFDTKLLYQQRQQIKIEKDLKKEIPYPKAKFFDFITRELDRQIEQKCGPLKNIQKSNTQQQQAIDAILYKLKLIDQNLINQQNILNEKPSTQDFYEVNQTALTTQRQLNLFVEKVENQNEYFRSEILQKLNDILYKEEFQDAMQNLQQSLQNKFEKKYIEKSIYEGQQQDLLHKVKQLQILIQENNSEIKKEIQSINDELKVQIPKIQLLKEALTKKQTISEFQAFKQKALNEFATKQEVNCFMDMIDPQLNFIQKQIGDFQKRIDDFLKFVKQIDYQLLSKATKMDNELIHKEMQNINRGFQQIKQALVDTADEQNKLEESFDKKMSDLSQTIKFEAKLEFEEQIKLGIDKYMKSYDLNEIEDKINSLKKQLQNKANKLEVIDGLKLKQNRAEALNTDQVINNLLLAIQSYVKILIEFMNLFSGSQDLESFNFKKSIISKLISDANAVMQVKNQNSVEKLRNRSESFKDEFHETSGAQKNFRQIQSPRLTTYKPLLRPLLTTTYTVANKKTYKLNSSNN